MPITTFIVFVMDQSLIMLDAYQCAYSTFFLLLLAMLRSASKNKLENAFQGPTATQVLLSASLICKVFLQVSPDGELNVCIQGVYNCI